jgi:hypothetical protein
MNPTGRILELEKRVIRTKEIRSQIAKISADLQNGKGSISWDGLSAITDKAVRLEAQLHELGIEPVQNQFPKKFALTAASESLGKASDAMNVFSKGFMVIPGGIREVTIGYNGKPLHLALNSNPTGADALQAQLEIVGKNTVQKVFNCFDHNANRVSTAASSWPVAFFWNSEKNAIYEIAEPSLPGLEAVDGKIYRGFSMAFHTDADIKFNNTKLPVQDAFGKTIWPGFPYVEAGAVGSLENPANIVCPDDAAENPEHYLNMGTMTNLPAFADNEPFFNV